MTKIVLFVVNVITGFIITIVLVLMRRNKCRCLSDTLLLCILQDSCSIIEKLKQVIHLNYFYLAVREQR
jgi:hypothetical protein